MLIAYEKLVTWGQAQRTQETSLRARLLACAATVLLSVPAAAAQTSTADNSESLETVVVSATRIERDGYTAPTPTTVVTAVAIEQRAMVNVGDALNDIPAFRGTNTPSAGGLGNAGAYLADLRGLGSSRTLVLLDKGRMPQTIVNSSLGAGTTDLNTIPTVLLKTAEVVTGGASAAYGSDAVSGVINFITDDRFVGVKGSAQYGQTRYGDAGDTFVTLAGGTSFLAGRGHAVLGMEYNNDAGTGIYNNVRDWGKQAYSISTLTNRPSGVPYNYIGKNGNYYAAATSGGLILSSGALKGLAFVPTASGGVTTAKFTAGLSNMTANTDFFTDEALAANKAAGINNLNPQQLRPAQRRYNILGKISYEINDHISAYVEPMFSHVTTNGILIVRRDGSGAGAALNIAKDNYYLDQALTAAQLASVPASGISLGYSGNDFGPIRRRIEKNLFRIQTGLNGDFEGWKWDFSYIYAQNKSDSALSNNFINANFKNAIDVVTENGQLVCRNTAARAAGCQPINILGKLNASDEARKYFMGTATGTGKSSLTNLAANVQGEPFSTWAGPVSLGAGMEYRLESIALTVDSMSAANGWLSGAGSPLNRASSNVWEGYVETIVPLASNMTLAKSLDFNGSLRYTQYSTSGFVTTWKLGLTWQPTDEIMVRTTRSRDIRAPNLVELYTPQSPYLPLPNDPRPGIARPTNAAGFVTGGNPDLKPEKSVTQTLGVVYQPEYVPGLRLSVDWYDIRMNDAITSTSIQGVIGNCFLNGVYTGNAWCSLITFENNDHVNGMMTSAKGITANAASFVTSGLDIQLNYRKELETLWTKLQGDINVNLQATYVFKYWNSTDISVTYPNGVDRAGQNGAIYGGPNGVPWGIVSLNMNYSLGKLGVNTNVRFVTGGHQNNGTYGPDQDGYNPALTTSTTNNNVPAVTYVNFGLTYDFGQENKYELFFNIDNLFDRDPPPPAAGTAFYDLMGRTYKGGVRFAF